MENPADSVQRKVESIFGEMAGERADALSASQFPENVAAVIAHSLTTEDYSTALANEIAFHLTDWNGDAAFLIALHLFPERFTADEICEGVRRFLIHAPNHVAAAARLAGYDIEDIFEDIDGEPV